MEFGRVVERIDLHMPNDWNAMTVEELETVGGVLVECASDGGNGAFSMKDVKMRLFLALAKLSVVKGVEPEKPVEEQYILVARDGKQEALVVYLWQIHYWMEELMGWIGSPPTLKVFPYPVVVRWSWRGRRKYEGPSMLMQNFSWRQYRLANEYMDYYIMESNRLVSMRSGDMPEREFRKQARAVARAKGLFLATLFNRRVRYVDTETKMVRSGYAYVSWQSVRNWHDFSGFSDVRFQVVLFWWRGTLGWLCKKYPKCFKASAPSKGAKSDPLSLYTRQTATMEKYLGINEEQLGRELYTNVLQHLQDMMDESDRMKELERKK